MIVIVIMILIVKGSSDIAVIVISRVIVMGESSD